MKVNCSPFLLIGFWVSSVVQGMAQFCPILTPPQGTVILCTLPGTSPSTGNCSEASPPLTLARVKCQAYYRNHDGSTERMMRCTRGGIWRRDQEFHNFSCHLDADGFVEKLIQTQKVLIFSRSTCSYCHETKELFDHLGEKYMPVEVDHLEPHKAELLKAALWRKTGMRTWPNVFVNGHHVGGNEATKAAHRDGRLIQWLQDNNNRI